VRTVTSTAGGAAGSARGWLIPVALFLVAVAVRLVVAALVPFPVSEGSAYYVGVARNLLEGDGPVTDALWSYATPPLTVPRPAFELWMPMTTFVAGAGMAVLGSTFWAAQVASCLLGASLAPLTWAVALGAAGLSGLDSRRARAVALSAGLLIALGSPFVISAAVPDSYTPYVVASVGAALLVPGVVLAGRATIVRGLVLGASLGLAYLARQEVIWLGVAVLVATWVAIRRAPGRGDPVPTRIHDLGTLIARLLPVVIGGLVVVVPWLVRNAGAFGTPFPSQTLENAVLRRNEDIYAFAERPSLGAYLGQDVLTLLGNPVAAAWDGLLNVVVLPAFPIGVAGLVAVVLLWRSSAFHVTGALGVLLLSGLLTFVTTVLLFPVATRWGTFLHASGPLLVALAVSAVLGGDALLARISAVRRWDKPNVIVAPIALVSITLVLLGLQVLVVSRQAERLEARYAAVRSGVEAIASELGRAVPDVIVSDHPIWLAETLGRGSVALPDEELASLRRLATSLDTDWVVVVDERGRYPEALLGEAGRGCLVDAPVALGAGFDPDDVQGDGWLFILRPDRCSSAEAGA
jgi:hypothetical protein